MRKVAIILSDSEMTDLNDFLNWVTSQAYQDTQKNKLTGFVLTEFYIKNSSRFMVRVVQNKLSLSSSQLYALLTELYRTHEFVNLASYIQNQVREKVQTNKDKVYAMRFAQAIDIR